VRTLRSLGYVFQGREWIAASAPADTLGGCTKGSDEEGELETIVDLLEAYEAKRWPLVPPGCGCNCQRRPQYLDATHHRSIEQAPNSDQTLSRLASLFLVPPFEGSSLGHTYQLLYVECQS
jgi:hypothetical protein